MKFFISLTRSLLVKLWMLFAAIIVLVAVVTTTVRLAMPALNQYRGDIEAWISEFVGQNVRISEISGEWRGLSPKLVVKDVRLMDATDTRPLMRFREAYIGLDFYSSLKKWQLEPGSLTVVGAKLLVSRDRDGRIAIEGFAVPVAEPRDEQAIALARWFFQQVKLGIRDSEVHWRDERTGRDMRFVGVRARLRSDGMRHQVDGGVELPQGLGQRLEFALDFEGDMVSPEGWSGTLYAKGEDILIDPWLSDWARQWFPAVAGDADFTLWSTWQGGRLQKVEGGAQARGIRLTGAAVDFSLGAEQFAWQRLPQGWRFDAKPLRLSRDKETLPSSRVSITASQEGDAEAQTMTTDIDMVRLQDVALLVGSVPKLFPEVQQALAALEPRGELHDVRLRYRAPGTAPADYAFSARFRGLGARPWRGIPGVQGLAGTVNHSRHSGRLSLAMGEAGGSVNFPAVFRTPLQVERLAGIVQWHRVTGGWHLEAEDLVVSNADISAVAGVAVELFDDDGASPLLDITVAFGNGNVEHASIYFPVNVIPKNTLTWLDRGLVSGRVVSGTAAFRGPVRAFPFDKKEGTFGVRFKVENVLLDYQVGWPRIDEIEADVTFDGRRMEINAAAGKIFSADILRARAVIPDLGAREPVLSVDGTTRGSVRDALRYLDQSPLRAKFQNYLAGTSAEGDGVLDLALKLPLSARPAEIAGSFEFRDSTLRFADLPEISKVNGSLRFSEAAVSADDIRGHLLGEPAEFKVRTVQLDKLSGGGAATEIEVGSRTDPRALGKQLALPLIGRMQGKPNWVATLQFPEEWGSSERATRLHVAMDLQGVAVDLPAPFAKTAAEALKMELRSSLSMKTGGDFTLVYGNRLSGAFELSPAKHGVILARGGLHIGPRTAVLPDGPMLRITGDLGDVPLAAWVDVLREQAGTERDSRLAFADDLLVMLDVDRLHLERRESDVPGQPADPRDVPALRIQARQFSYGNIDFGSLNMEVSKRPQGLHVDRLLMKTADMEVTADGDWLLAQGKSKSDFEMRLRHEDFGRLLKQFGYVSNVEGGGTDLRIGARWAGTPLDYALEKLNGKLYLKIGKGRFLDISPGVGRIFGLFSLQALPRRLLLDFSDLFKKGFSYDRIEGDFTVEDGNAYTNNLIMEGPSAKIVISGRTGLASEDYDQLVTVTPSLSGSLAVAGAVAGGPLGAAAAILAERLFKRQIRKITSHQYTVKGTWDDPVIKLVAPEPAKDAAGQR